MKEIARRSNFVPEATWLLRYRHTASGVPEPIGTIQGLDIEEWGAIQNLGISRLHRGRGLGSLLLYHAAQGFIRAGFHACTWKSRRTTPVPSDCTSDWGFAEPRSSTKPPICPWPSMVACKWLWSVADRLAILQRWHCIVPTFLW